MMEWLRLKILRWLETDPVIENKLARQTIGRDIEDRSVSDEPVMRFKVYTAIGGRIVEFSRHDRRNDRHEHTLYIINNDEDFGQRIAKIATLENLKN
jgi:hypothetical protein